MKHVYDLGPFFNPSIFIFPKKHRIIQSFQKYLNKKFGDRRRIQLCSVVTNRLNETFLFVAYGAAKNQTIVTLGTIIANRYLKILDDNFV